jgi:hypothetical protein
MRLLCNLDVKAERRRLEIEPLRSGRTLLAGLCKPDGCASAKNWKS